MKTALILLVLSLCPVAAGAQASATPAAVQASSTLKNQDVVSMLKAGLPADIVVAKIKASPCSFDTSPAELARLHADNVPNNVILAMVDASGDSRPAVSAAPSAAAPATSAAAVEPEPSGKPRVYVSDSQSWLMHGGFGMSHGIGAGAENGGSSPQTVEVIKNFVHHCDGVVVTDDRDRAGYVILFDRESYKGILRRRDKIAVFRRDGDALYSNSVHSVGGAVNDACKAIVKDSAASR